MKYISTLLILSMALFFLCPTLITAQENQDDIDELKKLAPKVYIDCGICDIDYIRTEITFVNYVRDRKEAQIHILITTLSTGGGGREYTIAFIGQNEFEGINDTQKYFTSRTDTSDEIREGLVKVLKIGLMSYVAKTPIASKMEISYQEKTEEGEVKDKWNKWVFSLSGSGYLSGEKTYKYHSLYSTFTAARVTTKSKINLSLSASQSKQTFELEDETLESSTESRYLAGSYIVGLNDHWSAGLYFRVASSSYENVDTAFSPSPAIEFNLFPYSESTRRQLRFIYQLTFDAVRYREETIYFKTKDNLLSESLSINLTLKEKWGSISTSLEGSHYFFDFSKNRMDIFSVVNVNLIKGLSLVAFGGGSRIHDQLSLVRGGASLEEVLLQRTQLETSYSYFFSVGFSYTFGSIYTNVVNPRFGSSGYGGMTVIID